MITFILIQPKRATSPIAILVSFRGKKFRKSIGESVAVRLWNKRLKQVRVTISDPSLSMINDRIDLWRKAAEKTVEYFKFSPTVPSSSEFISRLESERWGNNTAQNTLLIPYFNTFISRYQGVRSESRIKHFRTCQRTLEEYETFSGKQLTFNDIDLDFYNRFTAWFNQKEQSLNYLGEKFRIIKTVMNDAMEIDHLHHNDAFKVKAFATPRESTDSVYLTIDELMRIFNLDINSDSVISALGDIKPSNIERKVSAMRKARDMFLIGAFTGLRYSDYSRLRPENISEGVIKIRNHKTGISTSVPEHWIISEIFKRGYDFDNPLFEQKLNFHIKEICKMAGICEEIIITKNIGGRLQDRVYKKYELVSSHTARRSFATNAYKAGIPSISIMKVTGHKRESTFMKYIKITDSENAEMLKSTSFFSKRNN